MQIIRPIACCGYSGGLGQIFRVVSVTDGPTVCGKCGHLESFFAALSDDRGDYIRVNRLKRIPPIEELDDVKRDEEITA